MANKKMSEGVGKKIVEALKKQSEIEISPKSSKKEELELDSLEQEFDNTQATAEEIFQEEDLLENLNAQEIQDQISEEETPILLDQPSVNYQQTASVNDNLIQELDNFEIPSNIAVLKKLISQLPSGVTRHTGAQIIKQTMEALGISMKSVLQEAQQVQEGLNNSASECYSTIKEYKKQIILLDKQAQNYQKQYSALNELISLFIQTGV